MPERPTIRARVLCVDDDAPLLSSMVRVLQERFEVVAAQDGATALRLAAEDPEPFAVIVTDQSMPGMDGLALLRVMQERHPATTRVMLTGRSDLDTAVRAINEGQVFKYLLKPGDPEELVRIVESAVELHETRLRSSGAGAEVDPDAPTLADRAQGHQAAPAPSASPARAYRCRRRIGRGVFGEIFLAEMESTAGFHRTVALKVLRPLVRAEQDAARRMRDEARLLGRLRHPHIVEVFDLVRLGGRWTIVMEYVPGANLDQIVRALGREGDRFPAPAAFDAGAAMFEALHAAWEAPDGQGGALRVLHRDIKPSNVRVTPLGGLKVLDFGVARMEGEDREAITRAGGWIGTERYMAPERILMEGDTPAGDVYAAAASVMELLLGRPLGRTPVREERHSKLVEDAVAAVADDLEGPSQVVARAAELLWAGLDARPEHRLDARALATGFAQVAGRLTGRRLARFAPDFVPRVARILGEEDEVVDETLIEDDPSDAGDTWLPGDRTET